MFLQVFLALCLVKVKFCDCVCTDKSFGNISVQIANEKCYVNECIDERLCNFSAAQYITVKDTTFESLQKGAVKNLPNLRSLVFDNNSIKYVNKRAFYNLPNLIILRIKNNRLNKVEKIFEQLDKLQYLTLNFNEISAIENEAISCVNLKELHLNSNKLTFLENKIFKSHLEKLFYLNVSDNDIRFIEPSFFDFIPNLRALDLSNNKITYLSEKSALNNIVTINLLNNQLMYLEPQLTRKFTNLLFFNIDLNPWDCECYFEVINWINSRNGIILVSANRETPICVNRKYAVKNSKCVYETDEEALNYFNNKVEWYNALSTIPKT